jgi:hypothetical protein
MSIIRKPAALLHEVKPDIILLVSKIVSQAMEKRPENRPANVMTFAQQSVDTIKIAAKQFKNNKLASIL